MADRDDVGDEIEETLQNERAFSGIRRKKSRRNSFRRIHENRVGLRQREYATVAEVLTKRWNFSEGIPREMFRRSVFVRPRSSFLTMYGISASSSATETRRELPVLAP